MSKTGFRVACLVAAVGFLAPAFATEQVYHPVSPTLGGNPLNGPFLLSTAQAQGEGVNSGNQGPNLTPLANAISNGIDSGTTPQTGMTAPATPPAKVTSGQLANPTMAMPKMP